MAGSTRYILTAASVAASFSTSAVSFRGSDQEAFSNVLLPLDRPHHAGEFPELAVEATLADATESAKTGLYDQPGNGEQEVHTRGISLEVITPPSAWTAGLEREFRALATKEATEQISTDERKRLETLSSWREDLVDPRSPEEVRLEIRHDSLLEQFAKTLDEYNRFQNEFRKAPARKSSR